MNIQGLPYSAEGYAQAKEVLQKRYGCEEEIVAAFMKEIMDVPRVQTANYKRVEESYAKLNVAVRALQTMGKASSVSGNAALALEKFPAIKGDLVRTDPNWRKWVFMELLEALEQWLERNTPANVISEESQYHKKEVKPRKAFQTRDHKPRGCVYCGNAEHRTTECDKVTDVAERKELLVKKRLCFNCASGEHRANTCPSKKSCSKCEGRHHTSICNVQAQTAFTTKVNREGMFPIVTVRVNGIKTRALIDSGSGGSYMSAFLAGMQRQKPQRHVESTIEMMLSSKRVRLSVCGDVASLDGSYHTNVELTKVERDGPLLTIENPQYKKVIDSHEHLRGKHVLDEDQKEKLPVHVVLGKDVYARIKTPTKPRLGGGRLIPLLN